MNDSTDAIAETSCAPEGILITGEIDRRPRRPPDFQAEYAALQYLASALSGDPETLLQQLAESACELCAADTAGISIAEEDDIRWLSVAGTFSRYAGRTMPRLQSPCGFCLQRPGAQLFAAPGNYFAALAEVSPVISEQMTLTLAVDGEAPTATLWIATHHGQGFNAEDLRILTALAGFATAALRIGRREGADAGNLPFPFAERRISVSKAQEAITRLEGILNTAVDGIVTIDECGRIESLNPAVERIFAYPAAELLGSNIALLIPDLHNGAPDNYLHNCLVNNCELKNNAYFRCETAGRRRNGSVFPLELTVSEQHLPDRRIFTGLLRDVTERRSAEAALRESEERMQEALSVSHSFTFEWDPASDKMNRSASCEKILGLANEVSTEIRGIHYYRRVHPEDLARLQALQSALHPGNDHYSTQYRITRSDGSIAVLEENARGFFNDAGALMRLVGVCTDETARERAEQERQMFVSLTDSSGEFIGMCDLDFVPFYVNAAGMHMVGLDNLAAARRIQVRDCFFPEDRPFLSETFFPRLLRDGKGETEVRFRHFKTGEAFWMLLNVFAIRDERNTLVGWATVSRNIDARKRAEEALHQATQRERFLADVIDNADIPFRAGTADNRLIMCNRAFTELTGYSREELMQPDFDLQTRLTPPEWRETDAAQQALAIRTRQPVRYEKEYLRKDGTRIPAELFIQPVFDTADHYLHYRVFATDISQRKQTEAALQKAHDELETRVRERTTELQRTMELVQIERQRFKDVLDQLPAYLILLSPDYRVAFANRFFRERFGEDRGRRCYDYLFGLGASCPNCQTFNVLQKNAPQRWEWTGPDGRIYDIYDYPFTDADGSPLIMEIGLDITERRGAEAELDKHRLQLEELVRERTAQLEATNAQLRNEVAERKAAEQALREREEDLNRAQSLGRIGSWRMNVIHNELTWSDETYRIFGLPKHAAVDYATFLALVHPDDRSFVDSEWQACLHGAPYDIEFRIVGHEGHIRWARERAELEFDATGTILGGLGTTQDITERKRAEEALREANRRKDEFLATLAHELRNPLAPLRNAVEILRQRNSNAPEADKLRAMMERQISQLTRLVDDLLEVSRISRGKIELRFAAAPLTSVVDDAVDTSRPYIDAGKHRLSVSLPQTPLILYVDATRITQVLANLLINAAKFTPGGGSIELCAALGAGPSGAPGLVLCVCDNGIGVPDDMREHVFDMYAQVAHPGSGLGIGLTLVRKLVNMHGGEVSVHSNGTGRGSKFRIWLPPACLMETQFAPEEEAFAASAESPGFRILVVDDNRDAADSLAALLEILGWQVRQTYNGAECLEQVAVWRPQLVFLDIGMPDIDGCEVARRIRSEPGNDDIKLIALTGWGQEDVRQETRAAGFDRHLVKPVDIKLLEEVLAELN
ncbi:MAG: PAS domain S-box protein [Gammaproteobacteria bacterium]